MVAEEQLLTAEEAAQLLGTSQAIFIARLEEGALPFLRPDAEGRFRLQDIRACLEKLAHLRREKLEWMTEQAQQENLYDTPEDLHRQVVDDIRHGR